MMDDVTIPRHIEELIFDVLNSIKGHESYSGEIKFDTHPYSSYKTDIINCLDEADSRKFDIFCCIRRFVANVNAKFSITDEKTSFISIYETMQFPLSKFWESMKEEIKIKYEDDHQKKKCDQVEELKRIVDDFIMGFKNDIALKNVYSINQKADMANKLFAEFKAKQTELSKNLGNDEEKIQILSTTISTLQTQNDSIRTDNELFQSNLKLDIEKESKKSSETSMTVLGIFVGVVMVFFGGFTILENSISGMAESTPYRLSFTMLLFGLILLNVVVMLFYLISKLTQKTITCECYKYIPDSDTLSESDSQNDTNGITYRKNCMHCASRKYFIGLCRFSHIVPYIYWGNAVILTLMFFVFFMYAFQGVDSNFGIREFGSVGVTWSQVLCSVFPAGAFFGICFWASKTRSAKKIQKERSEEARKQERSSSEDNNVVEIKTNVLPEIKSQIPQKTSASFTSDDGTSNSSTAGELIDKRPQENTELVDSAGSTVAPPC